jgi:putative flippase GtrA
MIRWALVGVATFVIDYIIFLSLYTIISSVLIANFTSGVFSISFNYLAHYSFSFESNATHSKSGVKYLINLIIFWGISTILLNILISSGIAPQYAKLIPVPIIAPLSFLSLKFLVFNQKNK